MKALHSQEVHHRDLKPENIMFNDKLVPKIIDFGIANEKVRGVGTKLYFTPEEYYKEFDFNLKKVDY